MDIWGRLFSILWFIGAASALRWSNKLGANSGTLQVCSGQNIQLFWNFTLDEGERLKGMVWGCQPEGEEETSLATYVEGHFVPISSYSGRLAHVEVGGIELSCATILESGNYSVAVTVENRDNSLTVHHKTVPVNVIDTPKTQSGEIHVTREEEAVLDVLTQEWHVQLACGNFSDRGHPPVDVMWTDPKGEQLQSSGFEDGFFLLKLPNPVVGGNYSCRISPSSASSSSHAAGACLPKDSPLRNVEMTSVNETAGRFSVLEARQRQTRQKSEDTGFRVAQLETDLANITSVLTERIDQLVQHLVAVPVSFHTRLTNNVQLSTGSILQLNNVLSNQGGGYDPFTGYFTAPANGTYFLIATTGPYSGGNYANMRMMREGSAICDTSLYRADDRSMGSCHGVLYLKAGERAWLQSTYSNSFVYAYVTSFSGFRIY